MKRLMWVAILVLLVPSMSFAADWEIETARGTQTISDGEILAQNSMWEGQITNVNPLEPIIFLNWNFDRLTLQDVFVNCSNIVLIECRLKNVQIPPTDGSEIKLTGGLRQREKIIGNEIIVDNEHGVRTIHTFDLVDGVTRRVLSTRKEKTPDNEKFTITDSATRRVVDTRTAILPE